MFWAAVAKGVTPANGVNPDVIVLFVPGVVTNEKVGSAAASTVGDVPDDISPARVGNASVGTDAKVSMEAGVFVGAASAVCVNCPESWATVVPTIAVFTALTSKVGAGVANDPQAASKIEMGRMIAAVFDFIKSLFGSKLLTLLFNFNGDGKGCSKEVARVTTHPPCPRILSGGAWGC